MIRAAKTENEGAWQNESTKIRSKIKYPTKIPCCEPLIVIPKLDGSSVHEENRQIILRQTNCDFKNLK